MGQPPNKGHTSGPLSNSASSLKTSDIDDLSMEDKMAGPKVSEVFTDTLQHTHSTLI